MSYGTLRVTHEADWSRLIVFAQRPRIIVGTIAGIVTGAIVVGGIFLPGDLPHVDTPDTLPGPPQIAQSTSPDEITLGVGGPKDGPKVVIIRPLLEGR